MHLFQKYTFHACERQTLVAFTRLHPARAIRQFGNQNDNDNNVNNIKLTKRIHFSPALKRIIGASQHWRCNGPCGQLLPASFQIDHILPLHQGGDNTRENLQALCATCHAEKSYVDLYEGGKQFIPSGESDGQPTMDKIELKAEMQSTSMAVCKTCGVTHSLYFLHMCKCTGC
jgi:5-methylcytosine-specific restriction endonuclease McrA